MEYSYELSSNVGMKIVTDLLDFVWHLTVLYVDNYK